ncbi:MAG: MarR family winged helix-turn-helix transcriptional regulator [Dehalococcoidia bacterium]
MAEQFEGKTQNLRAFMLLHRVRDLLFRCQDRAVGEFGLTAEQYSVLVAIAFLDDPVRATDIGRWMDRKVNSISMIVDRMVRAGLVSRERDLPDRREVRLAITKEGEQALKAANPKVSRLVEDILSSLSREDAHNLIRTLETLRDRAARYYNPEVNIREMATYETEDMASLMRRMARYHSTDAPKTARRGRARRRK